MSLEEIINEILTRREKNRMQEKVKDVKDEYDKGDTKEEGVEKAVDRIIGLIQANPDMPVIKFLKLIEEEEETSNDVLVEATKQIHDIKSEETTVKVVKALDLPSKGIQEIIKEADVSLDTAKKMAEEIPDEEIQEKEKERLEELERRRKEEQRKKEEEKLKKELKEKYVKCHEIPTSILIGEIKEIEEKAKTPEIHNIIKQILARKAAIEWKHFGTTRISEMTKVITGEEMLREDFPKLVEEEFKGIKNVEIYQGKKEYTEEALQKLILDEIQKRTQNKQRTLNIEVEKKLEKVKQELKSLDPEEAMEILKETAESIEQRRQEREEKKIQSKNGATQSDDDEEFMH